MNTPNQIPSYQPPPGQSQPPPDLINTLIPRNGSALISYYCGIFGLLGCVPVIGLLGIPLGIVAVIFGFKGLSYQKQNPGARGGAHAIVGIILGAIGLLTSILWTIIVVIGITANRG